TGPGLTELALPLLPVASRIGEGVEERLAGGLDEARPRSATAFGGVEEPLVSLMRGDSALDSCHGELRLLEVRQQALDLPSVLGPDDALTGVAARPSRRLDLEMVAAPRPHADHFSAAGHAETLLGRLVTLHLGHCGLTLLLTRLPAVRPGSIASLVWFVALAPGPPPQRPARAPRPGAPVVPE